MRIRLAIIAVLGAVALAGCNYSDSTSPFISGVGAGLGYSPDKVQSVYVCTTFAGKVAFKNNQPGDTLYFGVHLALTSSGGFVDISNPYKGYGNGGMTVTWTSFGKSTVDCYEFGQTVGDDMTKTLSALPITLVNREAFMVVNYAEAGAPAKAFLDDAQFSSKGDLYLDLTFDFDHPEGSTTAEIIDRIVASIAPNGLAGLAAKFGTGRILREP